jgi:hypothetical protein
VTAFATKDEALEAVAAVRSIVERFPVSADEEMHRVVGQLQHVEGAVQACAFVDPAEARGTEHFRRVHGLPALTIETET